MKTKIKRNLRLRKKQENYGLRSISQQGHSCDPLRSDSKAIFEPSGETVGLFWLRVDAMSICATGSAVRLSFQMFAEKKDCT
jgi:hypothetical protein